jgi:hypothetical protein
MHGPTILINGLQQRVTKDKFGNVWQYHSRSDRHSKVACWGVAFDLISSSNLLRDHLAAGQVVLGVNHELTDYGSGRPKKLDLVFARPNASPGRETLQSLATRYKIPLSAEQQGLLNAFPAVPVAPVGAVLVALEAKATMTAHIRALPRLFDELTSSHMCVHGASRQALAIGFAMVNASPLFVSSDRNKHDLATRSPEVSTEPQPRSLERTIAKIKEIPRRSNVRDSGFDGVGIVVIQGVNDGSPFALVSAPPAPQPGTTYHYDSMIARMANEYDTTFASI